MLKSKKRETFFQLCEIWYEIAVVQNINIGIDIADILE